MKCKFVLNSDSFGLDSVLERAVLETPIHLILISSFLTWAKTPVDMVLFIFNVSLFFVLFSSNACRFFITCIVDFCLSISFASCIRIQLQTPSQKLSSEEGSHILVFDGNTKLKKHFQKVRIRV